MTEEMKTIDDGGYAFPIPADDKAGWHAESGMTLRDWFAGQAIGPACTLAFGNIGQASEMGMLPEEWAAKIALRVSDELIASRKAGA